jgi:hypothetical protein
MKNCLYAAMGDLAPRTQKVTAQQYDSTLQEYITVDSVVSFYQVLITNELQNPQQSNLVVAITLPLSAGPVVVNQTVTNVTLPGALITTPFPVEANIRWLEMKFKSIDPLSPDFLIPDWDDPNVKKLVVDQGYPDADGSIADLGAIPYGGKVADVALIRPLSPVIIAGDNATLTFDVSVESGTFNNPKIKYIRFIKNVPFGAAEKDAFGPATKPIPAANILDVAAPGAFTVQKGSNSLTVTTPARLATEVYAFYEIVLEGTGGTGKPVASNMGFMPYRKFDKSDSTASAAYPKPPLTMLNPKRNLVATWYDLKGRMLYRHYFQGIDNRLDKKEHEFLRRKNIAKSVYLLQIDSREYSSPVAYRKIYKVAKP